LRNNGEIKTSEQLADYAKKAHNTWIYVFTNILILEQCFAYWRNKHLFRQEASLKMIVMRILNQMIFLYEKNRQN